MSDHMTIHDKRYDVKDFVHEHYNDTLPVHTSDADVHVLWVASDRMKWFKSMADAAQTQHEYDLFTAIYDDYQMIFYGILYATSCNSDKLAAKDATINDLKARLGDKTTENIFAQTG